MCYLCICQRVVFGCNTIAIIVNDIVILLRKGQTQKSASVCVIFAYAGESGVWLLLRQLLLFLYREGQTSGSASVLSLHMPESGVISAKGRHQK